jgi:hypothetical protein
MQEGVRDLLGKDIRVGAIVAFSMNSYGGYLGVGLVLEVLTEVLPFHLKVRVMKASKRKGPQAGTVLILGNAFHRAQDPGADLDTVLVLDLVESEIRL